MRDNNTLRILNRKLIVIPSLKSSWGINLKLATTMRCPKILMKQCSQFWRCHSQNVTSPHQSVETISLSSLRARRREPWDLIPNTSDRWGKWRNPIKASLPMPTKICLNQILIETPSRYCLLQIIEWCRIPTKSSLLHWSPLQITNTTAAPFNKKLQLPTITSTNNNSLVKRSICSIYQLEESLSKACAKQAKILRSALKQTMNLLWPKIMHILQWKRTSPVSPLWDPANSHRLRTNTSRIAYTFRKKTLLLKWIKGTSSGRSQILLMRYHNTNKTRKLESLN